jgi:ABC-type glycerol-3-phosphate transport system substrate-binding protein
MKKIVFLLIATLLVTSVAFAGCGNSGGSEEAPPEQDAPAEETQGDATPEEEPAIAATDDMDFASANIDWKQCDGQEIRVMYSNHPYQEAVEPLLPEFEALTGIKVNFEKMPEQEFWDKLMVEFSGGGADAPDVYMINNPRLAAFDAGGWIEDVTPYTQDPKLTDLAWYGIDDFYESALDYGRFEGIQYGFPITGEWDVLFYRKDLYEEKGLSVPKTMDELYENAVAINSDDCAGIVNRFSRSGTAWWPWAGFVGAYGTFCLTPGDNTPQFTDPKTLAATEMYVKLVKDAGTKGIVNYDWSEATMDFQQGRAGHFLDSSVWMAQFEDAENSAVAGKVGYAPMPIGAADQGDQYTALNYWLQAISAKSDNKEASWLYLQWATSKKIALDVAIKAGTAARASIWENEDFLKTVPVDFANACAEGAKTGAKETVPELPQWGEIAEKICVTLNDIYMDTPVKEAMEKLQTETEKILAS